MSGLPQDEPKMASQEFGLDLQDCAQTSDIRHQTSNKQEADKYTHGQWSSKNTNRLIDTGARRHSADMKSVCLVDLQKAAK